MVRVGFWRLLAPTADTGPALPPGQTQQSRYYPPPAVAPHSGRSTGSRSRPLPAPPAIQPSPGAGINSSNPHYHHQYPSNEPIPPRAPLKPQYTHHVQGSASSLVSTQRPGSNQPPQHRSDIVDSQHGHSNGSQRTKYDYSGPKQNYGDPYQSGHRPPRISVPELIVDNLEPTAAHYRQSQAGGLSSHTAPTRRDYDPRRMPVAPTIPPTSGGPHSSPYYPPDGTSHPLKMGDTTMQPTLASCNTANNQVTLLVVRRQPHLVLQRALQSYCLPQKTKTMKVLVA
jgi:hypothetical protein